MIAEPTAWEVGGARPNEIAGHRAPAAKPPTWNLSMNGYSPSLPIASTGQDSIASVTWAISSSLPGCLWTNE